jgi:glycosyltransferase involved in cell wall biosynthesis
MKVSFTGAPEYMDRNVGYGEASFHVYNQFIKNNIECLINSSIPNIGIAFSQPQDYKFGLNQFKIGYTPWESTDLYIGWDHIFNKVCNEVWTTSEWVAQIYRSKTTTPVFVYEHGIEDEWIPKKRILDPSRPFRFLHIGEPAVRKDAQSVVNAFIELYGNDPNYELILKCSNLNTTKIFDPVTKSVIGSPNAFYKNIKIIESFLSVEQMKGLYELCDVFVYPSWGEGFGFNPLQAMASGMPTICTAGWATYKRFITMPVDSDWQMSPWQQTHPGQMLKPNYDELKFYMKDVAKNYEKYSEKTYKNAFLIHKDYNWEKISKPAIKRLKEIQTQYFN